MSNFLRRSIFSTSSRAFSTTTPNKIARITIVGNLAGTPELHPTSTGAELIKYSVASNSGPKDNRYVSWFRVTHFVPANNAEKRKDYFLNLVKGSTVYVEGDVSMASYKDAEGQSRSALNIVQRNFEVIKRGNRSNEGEEHSE